MKITEIKINNFGKIKQTTIRLTGGINVFYGQNESGKTTLMAFVLGMLYGVGKGEKRRQYEPWGGGKMGGRLSFDHEGKQYALERQFGVTRAADKIELWCVTSGEKISLPEKQEPGEFLLGINRESFLNSVYISQAGVPVAGDNNEIHSKLLNLAASGDETASRQEIIARLNNAAADLSSKRANAKIPALEKEKTSLLEERATILSAMVSADSLREEIAKYSEQKRELEGELGVMEDENDSVEGARRLKTLDRIVEKKKDADAAYKKYMTLHTQMYGGRVDLKGDFVEKTRGLLNDYNTLTAVIEEKEKQVAKLTSSLETVDISSFESKPVIEEHREEIDRAIIDYRDMRDYHDELEQKLRMESKKRKESAVSLKNIIIIGTAAALVLLLLGIKWHVCFIFAAAIAVIVGAYVFIQKRGRGFGQPPEENIAIRNVRADMREANLRLFDVLDALGLRNIDELDREMQKIRQTEEQISRLSQEREEAMTELYNSKKEQQQRKAEIEDLIRPFREGDVKASPMQIMRGLDKALREHDALEADWKEKQAAFEAVLDGGNYDKIAAEADELNKKLGSSKDRFSDYDYDKFKGDKKEKAEELDKVNEQLIKLNTEVSLIGFGAHELSETEDRIRMINKDIERLEFELSAINLAKKSVDEAFDSMQKDFGPALNYRASSILSELTGGKYSSMFISDALVPSVDEKGNGGIRGFQSFSSGTVDQIYLSLRLAVADILSDEPLPVMLDEAFAQFDDERMRKALEYLSRENKNGRVGQIVLFTCHDRVQRAASKLGLDSTKIEF